MEIKEALIMAEEIGLQEYPMDYIIFMESILEIGLLKTKINSINKNYKEAIEITQKLFEDVNEVKNLNDALNVAVNYQKEIEKSYEGLSKKLDENGANKIRATLVKREILSKDYSTTELGEEMLEITKIYIAQNNLVEKSS